MNEKGIVVSIKEASRILNTLKGEVYELINNNKISSIKENNRTFVYLSEINKIKKKRSKRPITKKNVGLPGRP